MTDLCGHPAVCTFWLVTARGNYPFDGFSKFFDGTAYQIDMLKTY